MRRLVAITICFLSVFTAQAVAQPESPEIPPETWEEPSESFWVVGPLISLITYEEKDFMEQKGMMYGVSGAYTYKHEFMLKAEVDFTLGQVDYDSTLTGSMDNIDDYMFELRGLVGYYFPIFGATTVVPFTGLGYRYLNDDSGGRASTTGAWGYMREANYVYSPIGVGFRTELDQGWSWGLILEYDIFWSGLQKSYLSDVNLGFNDLENRQDEGYGVRASVRVEKKGEELGFAVEPFIRYWSIEDSRIEPITYAGVIVGYGLEPKNSSAEFGVKFSVTF